MEMPSLGISTVAVVKVISYFGCIIKALSATRTGAHPVHAQSYSIIEFSEWHRQHPFSVHIYVLQPI